MADNNTGVKDMFLRGIAVLGLIAVLLLGAWGIIQIAVNLPGFLGGVGGSVSSVFNRQSTTTTTVISRTSTTTTSSPTKTTTNKGASSTYVSSGTRQNLYGAPDLAVRVISAIPVWGGRTNVSFEIVNYGTNLAPSGWSFVAELPIMGNYPYYSASQQAFYPGDRIVYTLGFDSYDYGYDYGYDYYNYEDDCEWDDDDEEWDCDNNYDRRDRDYRNRDGHFSVTVDPYGQVYEINEFNNFVSLSI